MVSQVDRLRPPRSRKLSNRGQQEQDNEYRALRLRPVREHEVNAPQGDSGEIRPKREKSKLPKLGKAFRCQSPGNDVQAADQKQREARPNEP
jgi:hypothetical protein